MLANERDLKKKEKISGDGSTYKGKQKYSRSGLHCANWVETYKVGLHKFKNLRNQRNYCRNPDDSDGIWCYTKSREIYGEYNGKKVE